jgi:hypothetical protein
MGESDRILVETICFQVSLHILSVVEWVFHLIFLELSFSFFRIAPNGLALGEGGDFHHKC